MARDFGLRPVPGGPAPVGTGRPFISADEEGPARIKRLKPFRIMDCAVTNLLFGEFVSATGFVTEAERFGWSFVFYRHVSDCVTETPAVVGTRWWRRVDEACWRMINGPGSETDWHPEHPAVHISWNDARAFAEWAGGRLPGEAK